MSTKVSFLVLTLACVQDSRPGQQSTQNWGAGFPASSFAVSFSCSYPKLKAGGFLHDMAWVGVCVSDLV